MPTYISLGHGLSRRYDDGSHHHKWDLLWTKSPIREQHIRWQIWHAKLLVNGGPDLRRSRLASNSWMRRTSNSSTADLLARYTRLGRYDILWRPIDDASLQYCSYLCAGMWLSVHTWCKCLAARSWQRCRATGLRSITLTKVTAKSAVQVKHWWPLLTQVDAAVISLRTGLIQLRYHDTLRYAAKFTFYHSSQELVVCLRHLLY